MNVQAPKRSWQPVIWGGIYVLLLLSFAIPLINTITMLLVMVPVLVMFMRFRLRTFVLTVAVCMALLWLLFSGFGLMLDGLSLFLMPPALVLGILYKRRASARSAIMAGIMTLLGEQLLALLVGYALGLDPIGSYRSYMGTIATELKPLLNINAEYLDRAIELVIQVIPFMMVSVAVVFVMVTHGASRWVLRRRGMTIPALPPLRQWRLPKSMVFYYLIVVGLDFFLNVEVDSILVTAVLNLMPALTIAFIVQALSFIAFVIHVKGWNRLFLVGAVVLMILVYPAMFLFSLIGLFDTAFPIRDRISGNGR